MSERMRLYNDLIEAEKRSWTEALHADLHCEQRVLWLVNEKIREAVSELRDALPTDFIENDRPRWYD